LRAHLSATAVGDGVQNPGGEELSLRAAFTERDCIRTEKIVRRGSSRRGGTARSFVPQTNKLKEVAAMDRFLLHHPKGSLCVDDGARARCGKAATSLLPPGIAPS